MSRFGEAIETARKSRKLSREKVARVANVSVSTIQRIERSDPNVEPMSIGRVAKAVGLDFDERSKRISYKPQLPKMDMRQLSYRLADICAELHGIAAALIANSDSTPGGTDWEDASGLSNEEPGPTRRGGAVLEPEATPERDPEP